MPTSISRCQASGIPSLLASDARQRRQCRRRTAPEPHSNIHASAIIQRLIEDREAQGAKPTPTSRQIRMLERFGVERGKTYKIPGARQAASALIKRLLETAAPAAHETAAA